MDYVLIVLLAVILIRLIAAGESIVTLVDGLVRMVTVLLVLVNNIIEHRNHR